MNSSQNKHYHKCLVLSLSEQRAVRMRWAVLQRALGVVVVVGLCSGMAQGRAQECGDNPMKQVLLVAKRAGRSLTHVLTLLRDIDGGAYDTLSQKFRLYAACVGLVDTGYFRKRSGATLPMVSPHERPARRTPFDHQIQVRDIEVANSELPFSHPDDEALPPEPTLENGRPHHLAAPHWRLALTAPQRSSIRRWLGRLRADLASGRAVRTQSGMEDAPSGR